MSLDTRPAPLDASGGFDRFAEFRVGHPRDVLSLLRQLRDGGVPVSLCAPGGTVLPTRLWAFDEQRQRLNFAFDRDPSVLADLIAADELAAVAYLDHVKIQFGVHDALHVRGATSSTLQTSLPDTVYRFQRRNGYRVRPPAHSVPQIHLRHPAMPEMALALRLLDISCGGCALLVPDDVPLLEPGTRIGQARLSLDAATHLDVGVSLQHVSRIGDGDAGSRIGCAWIDLSGSAERVLQRYVDQAQKQRRLLGDQA